MLSFIAKIAFRYPLAVNYLDKTAVNARTSRLVLVDTAQIAEHALSEAGAILSCHFLETFLNSKMTSRRPF
jgi:uncharacterized membrane protein YqhA